MDVEVEMEMEMEMEMDVDVEVDVAEMDVDVEMDTTESASTPKAHIDTDLSSVLYSDSVHASNAHLEAGRDTTAHTRQNTVQGTKATVAMRNPLRSFFRRINPTAIVLFLLWFGFFGYVFLATTQLSRPITVVLAIISGVLLARIILALLKSIFGRGSVSTKLDLSDHQLVNRKAKVIITIPEHGVGKISYYVSPDGPLRGRAARSRDGQRIDRGQEVVILKTQKGIAVVDRRRSPTH